MESHAMEKVGLPFNLTTFYVAYVCESFPTPVISKGVFLNDNPLHHSISFLLSQLGIAILLRATFRYLLRPFKQPRFVAEILAGIVAGPSLFQLLKKEDLFFSYWSSRDTGMMRVLENVGLMTFSFVVGVRTDVGVIKSAGKLSWVIGSLGFLIPYVLVLPTTELLKRFVIPSSDPFFRFQIYWVSVLVAPTSFQVTSFLLEDLKLLNSEIGRLAMSSALISSSGSWIFTIFNSFVTWAKLFHFGPLDYAKSEITRVICILIIIFGLRRIMFRLMRNIPEGKSIKEHHFFAMVAMFLAVAFVFEYFGYKGYFGAMILGLSVPSGPPLGSGLVEKLEILTVGLLLPVYIVDVGRYIDVFQITWARFKLTVLIIFLAIVGKLAAAMVPSIIGKMPFKDSLALGLVLSSQGFFDVFFFKLNMGYSLISNELFIIMVMAALLSNAIFTPLICYLYDPSKRFQNYKRRTIQQSAAESELRILVCVYEEDQVFSLMNVLKASHPTPQSPIAAFVLNLVELVGRDHPLLINHQFHQRKSATLTRTDRIISAFDQYERRSEGTTKHQFYTTVAPFTTMHEDVCFLALEKSTALLVMPFNKAESGPVRGVIRNVLERAPCSVGILVDKKIVTHWRSDSLNQARFHVCVIFFGGADCREALSYGIRMAENLAINLSVIRLIAEDEFVSDLVEMKLDVKAIQDLRTIYEDNQRIEYREVVVKDGVETSGVLLALDDEYDFMLVGRRLNSNSPLVAGLTDWSYIEELGIIGDILASSDMKCNASVMVIQQQSIVGD